MFGTANVMHTPRERVDQRKLLRHDPNLHGDEFEKLLAQDDNGRGSSMLKDTDKKRPSFLPNVTKTTMDSSNLDLLVLPKQKKKSKARADSITQNKTN